MSDTIRIVQEGNRQQCVYGVDWERGTWELDGMKYSLEFNGSTLHYDLIPYEDWQDQLNAVVAGIRKKAVEFDFTTEKREVYNKFFTETDPREVSSFIGKEEDSYVEWWAGIQPNGNPLYMITVFDGGEVSPFIVDTRDNAEVVFIEECRKLKESE